MRTPQSLPNARLTIDDDTSPTAMAARFGARTIQLLHAGREVRESARLAASYAFMVDPSLREPASAPDLAGHVWRLGLALNTIAVEALHVPDGTVIH